ncbi:RDD family protein [Streptomyces sp. RFCAC02]|uniref:RDD family protein n=1 Tax=Streptomyces sp. RFCAC02 TaxID=2499143 RepID=UPI0010201066|nr:RDD family protein [Streptomyces sp. RFCAC02]
MASIPDEADEGWLLLVTATDVLLALGAGIAGAQVYAPDDIGGVALSFVGCALAFSFVNHVFGMWVLRASIGKLVWGLRVVRVPEGGRPGFWRAVARWLVGYVLFALMALIEDGGGVGEACSLRTVRRRDLRRYAGGGYRA